jgi:hypothetical protein
MALRHLHGQGAAKWIWRCHIDTSQPHPEEGKALGVRGRATVRDRFLLPRLIADDLRLYAALLNK